MNTPKQDGYRMPGEFEPHHGCLLVWPQRPGSWPFEAKPAREAFARLIREIAKTEKVYLCAGKAGIASAREALKDVVGVTIISCETDDAWARDIGPTFLVSDKRKEDGLAAGDSSSDGAYMDIKQKMEMEAGSNRSWNSGTEDAALLRCVNWRFNAWGGNYDGLYAEWSKDDAFAKWFHQYLLKQAAGGICDIGLGQMYDYSDFVLEGGSIHSDGEGTVIVTERCLLSPGRNPELSREQIEQKLCEALGAECVIWLPYGIYQDETNEHVDNVCAFICPGEVVLAWTDDESDPQYAMSKADLEILMSVRDAKGRKLKVHKLPIPEHTICITEEDLPGYIFEPGEDEREVGERLAASYVNFYFSNGAVLLPAFGGENEESDKRAQMILQELCPERIVCPIPARDILLGGGNIHCITQQIPLGKRIDSTVRNEVC